MTDFILMKTLDAARATIKETQDAILSLSQRMKIAEIISNPIPAPVTADLLALREHSINFNLSSLKENNRNGTDLTKPRTTRS